MLSPSRRTNDFRNSFRFKWNSNNNHIDCVSIYAFLLEEWMNHSSQISIILLIYIAALSVISFWKPGKTLAYYSKLTNKSQFCFCYYFILVFIRSKSSFWARIVRLELSCVCVYGVRRAIPFELHFSILCTTTNNVQDEEPMKNMPRLPVCWANIELCMSCVVYTEKKRITVSNHFWFLCNQE